MSTLKVDNIQHTNGTDAMTIDSDGSVQLKKYVTGSEVDLSDTVSKCSPSWVQIPRFTEVTY